MLSDGQLEYHLSMQASVRKRILNSTQAQDITEVQLIQPLWNNYGTLSRVHLTGGKHPSVILKHIKIPDRVAHPRGFTSDISKERKIKSYQVETHWYREQNKKLDDHAATPNCLDAFDDGCELFILLEDLSHRGFVDALYSTSWNEVTLVLHWLAHFHARFLHTSAEGLWPTGTYWHLATRPEELSKIQGTRLHRFATLIDARLNSGAFQTLVHGDAKLANFLFNSARTRVAAVDFQYVGQGCAMRDVAYFMGSCLSSEDCERHESKILDIYFSELRTCLPSQVDAEALEREWRQLYAVAWADFERFMTGWSPQHRKLTKHSDATTERAIDQIVEELLSAARKACMAAGTFIQENKSKRLEVASKGFAGRAADVVTQIDVEAQAIILDILEPSITRFNLGLLAEEGEQDDSRLHKHAFWAVDPLDGTQYFIDGQEGYATSIALVAHDGQSILGVVYDPANNDLYEAVTGHGVKLNGKSLEPASPEESDSSKTTWFADLSLRKHPNYEIFKSHFEIEFAGGAVMNSIQLLKKWNSCYCRPPKKDLGGCAIWDLAAVSLMIQEQTGYACFFDADPLHLNRSQTVFYNDRGLAFTSSGVNIEALLQHINALIG